MSGMGNFTHIINTKYAEYFQRRNMQMGRLSLHNALILCISHKECISNMRKNWRFMLLPCWPSSTGNYTCNK